MAGIGMVPVQLCPPEIVSRKGGPASVPMASPMAPRWGVSASTFSAWTREHARGGGLVSAWKAAVPLRVCVQPLRMDARSGQAERRVLRGPHAAQGKLRRLVRLHPVAADVRPVSEVPAALDLPARAVVGVRPEVVSSTVHSVSWWTLLFRCGRARPATSTNDVAVRARAGRRAAGTRSCRASTYMPASSCAAHRHLARRAAEVPLQDQLSRPTR